MEEVQTVIRFEEVSKSFPGVKALSDITLDVRKGEILGIIGENGAGKSTLVKILAGVYQKDSGEVFINNERCVITSAAEARRRGLSFIFQERNLAPFLSIQENLFAGRQPVSKLGFVKWKELARESARILEQLRCTLNPARLVDTLSVAEQQLIEIGRALSFRSGVIVMDEPTASISDEEVSTLFSIVRELKGKGVTTLFISHRLREVLELTDRISVLRDGRLVGTLITKETSIDEIIRLMVGREVKDVFNETKLQPKEKTILSVRNLCSEGAFKDVSFDLKEGEILGLAGLVGARRTEVLRALFGYGKITGGEIHINGKKAEHSSPQEAMKAGIGYLSEDKKGEGIFPFMGVDKNITIAALADFTRFGFVNKQEERSQSRKLVEKLNIKTPGLTTLLFSLSGGNQQKTLIARGLMKKPRIFLLDEPTAGIDVGAKFEIYGILRRLASEGVGIVFVSSELLELMGVCHRILVMCQGRLTGEFQAHEFNQEKIMVCATRFD